MVNFFSRRGAAGQPVQQCGPSMASCHFNNHARHTAGKQPRSHIIALLSFLLVVSAAAGVSAVQPRIAIVSEKAFHLEVLAGFMTVLEEYASSTVVYMHPLNFQGRQLDFGFLEFMQGFKGSIRGLPTLHIPQFDMVIFVSPEYRVEHAREFIRRSKPKLVFLMVHNGDADGVPWLPGLHPNAHLLTLSPHVQKFVNQRLNTTSVDWVLPLRALQPQKPCKPDELNACLSGFAIQGNMDSKRRNYTEIWRELDVMINSSMIYQQDKRLAVNIVGSGKPERLGVPQRLEGRIIPHVNLKFVDFYELIYHNFALIPTLASDAYYDRKFSSTLITSMVTGVPVIVDWRFLEAYKFLNQSHVVMQWKNDLTMDVVMRMLEMDSQDLADTRAAIAGLREELNQRALRMIKQLLQPVIQQLEAEALLMQQHTNEMDPAHGWLTTNATAVGATL